jgi:GTPase
LSYKSGFVSVVGKPNVGKSTLINNIAGWKVSIVSDKPQTTRNTIRAIITKENYQMVFIDTPGIHKPGNKLGEFMVKAASRTLNEVDAVLFIIDGANKHSNNGDEIIIKQLERISTPVFLIINKIDLVEKQKLLPLIQEYSGLMQFKSIIPVSAITGEGTEIMLKELLAHMPEGHSLFPEDMVTDQPERLLAAEFIREKILYVTRDEIPHGTGVDISLFKQRKNKQIIDIDADIYCEKDSHKKILIGKQGNTMKKIGMLARKDIENMLGVKVFLQLWIKVRPDWRNKTSVLRDLGYGDN